MKNQTTGKTKLESDRQRVYKRLIKSATYSVVDASRVGIKYSDLAGPYALNFFPGLVGKDVEPLWAMFVATGEMIAIRSVF